MNYLPVASLYTEHALNLVNIYVLAIIYVNFDRAEIVLYSPISNLKIFG